MKMHTEVFTQDDCLNRIIQSFTLSQDDKQSLLEILKAYQGQMDMYVKLTKFGMPSKTSVANLLEASQLS